MKICIDLGHPAQVHTFKHFIRIMKEKGHEFIVTARDKDITHYLLDTYGIPHQIISKKSPYRPNLIGEWISRDISLTRIARREKPAFMIGSLNPAVAHAAWINRITSVIFSDSEPESVKYPIADLLTIPFASIVLTLTSVRHSYGEKEIRLNTYKELAYLCPRYFTPDPQVLTEAGITSREEYVILRFVGWGAYHDVGRKGMDREKQLQLVHALEEHANVFISSENPLGEEFDRYRIPIPPEKMHDFLAFAKILVGDSQTMTTEAGVLGVPAVRTNSFVGERDMGNFHELQHVYGLISNYSRFEDALQRSIELLCYPDLRKVWGEKRERMLRDKIDFTRWLVWFFESYPAYFQQKNRMQELNHSWRCLQ
jgi:predicted glycosyltransferase